MIVARTQDEFQAAIDSGSVEIELAAEITVEINAPLGVLLVVKGVVGSLIRLLSGRVEAWGSSSVEARGSSRVVARGSSRVVAWGSSSVVAWESSSVVAWESSRVVAWESSRVVARESSRVVAWGSSSVEAWESSRVEAWGSSRVVARGSSSVEARESSRVVARESSSVVARESSRVVARESSRVVARESSSVEAWGSSRVEAWAAAALSIFGVQVKAKASSQVAVHLHQKSTCEGGVQIEVHKPITPVEWCEWWGAEIIGNFAVLYKGLSKEFKSAHGSFYAPGEKTVAADWDGGEQECGKGLHFSPTPSATKEFERDPVHFVACLVPLDQIAVHPDGQYPQKVKAPWCWNWYECDQFGLAIGEKFTQPIESVPVGEVDA